MNLKSARTPVLFTLSGLLVLALGSQACKTSQSTAPTEPASAASPETTTQAATEATAAVATVDWSGMNEDQRKEHMREVVMPAMKKVFGEHNAEKYGDIKCTLCHGEGAKQGNFEMPNKELEAISKEMVEKHPEMSKFMKEQVVPVMAQAMGQKPFDPATGQGFGCMACHPAAQ